MISAGLGTAPDQSGDIFLFHTAGHRDCPACAESDRRLRLADGNLANATFAEAAAIWRDVVAEEFRSRRIGERTRERKLYNLKMLVRFFRGVRLDAITPGHLEQYQQARTRNRLAVRLPSGVIAQSEPWAHPCGADGVNHELGLLGDMLGHSGLWAAIKPYYRRLHVSGESSRRALEDSEDAVLFAYRPGVEHATLALWAATITRHTSIAGRELRCLRLRDIALREPTIGADGDDLTPSLITVPAEIAKTSDRPRTIPLTPSAKDAVLGCLRRANSLGATRPEHFLFPLRLKRGEWDPTQCASRSFLRKGWAKLRDDTGLHGLVPYDMRHDCCTKLLERGVPELVVQEIMGHHPGSRMTRRYAHARHCVLAGAVMALERTQQQPPKKPPMRAQPAAGVERCA